MSQQQAGAGSELERKFSRIETWKEFLAKWKAVEMEEEAVGLLYAGPDIVIDPEGEMLKERIVFYLGCARYSNETIATIARQVIIKSWLRRVDVNWVGFSRGHLEATNLLLEFLQEPTEVVLKPPYPRFVAEWLLPLHQEWRYGHHDSYQGQQALRQSTSLIVKALCAWGLGYVLAVDGLKPEIIPVIKEFLDERKYEPGEVFFELSGYGNPLSDLSAPADRKKVNYIAACAFLKLKFWVGGGFTAKFIKTHPPKYLTE